MIYDLFITTGPSKLSCLTPVTGKVLDKLKTKTVILERKNYPITEGFSSTLKHLQVCLPPSVCPRYSADMSGGPKKSGTIFSQA